MLSPTIPQQPTPKTEAMVTRVLRDQKSDGGLNIKERDWDVHACIDAVFILRQLGGESEGVRKAMEKAADWELACHNADGGFGHYPHWHSDIDAVYFQFGTFIQAGRVPMAKRDVPNANTLSWGHAMQLGKNTDGSFARCAFTPQDTNGDHWVLRRLPTFNNVGT